MSQDPVRDYMNALLERTNAKRVKTLPQQPPPQQPPQPPPMAQQPPPQQPIQPPRMDIDTFHAALEAAVAEVPEPLLRELNGGFMTLPQAKQHPEAPGSYILGEYCVQIPGMGRYIRLYYGSFCRVYGESLSPQALQEKLLETVAHELRHHVESLAGECDLEVEDALQLRRLKQRYTIPKGIFSKQDR